MGRYESPDRIRCSFTFTSRRRCSNTAGELGLCNTHRAAAYAAEAAYMQTGIDLHRPRANPQANAGEE